MDSLELIVFNVGHGLSIALIERPENYVVMVDLGCDNGLSPIEYLLTNMKVYPDILYITHPHGDHIQDIFSVLSCNNPPTCINVQEYDWKDVEKKEKTESKLYLKAYVDYINRTSRGQYSGNADLRYWSYSPEVAKEIFGDSSYINNSSLFIIYTWRNFKIAIPGDLHSNAIDNFLNHEEFRKEAKGTDILVAPHHGHKEGFNSSWVEQIGKPFITLISVQERDSNTASGYSSPEFAKGIKINNETRYVLTTREDGNIKITMYYNDKNNPAWNFNLF